MFFDIGGEIANGMVPSGGVVVKMIDKMTKQKINFYHIIQYYLQFGK